MLNLIIILIQLAYQALVCTYSDIIVYYIRLLTKSNFEILKYFTLCLCVPI